jgi:hypothetical protein
MVSQLVGEDPGECERVAERSHQEIAWRDTDERTLIPYTLAGTLSLDLPQSVKLSTAIASYRKG